MKNFKYAFLMAAAIVLGFSSCSNDEDGGITGDNSNPKSVFLKIGQGPATYSEGSAVVNGTAVEFSSGNLYFTNSSGTIIEHYTIKDGATTDENISLDALKGAGVTLTNLKGSIKDVYIVGNTSGLPTSGNISQVKEQALSVETQEKLGDINLYGTSALALKTAGTGTDRDLYAATVTLAPTVARIELTEITGGGEITAFEVEGVFVDNYYKQANIDGTVVSANLKDNGFTESIFTDNSTDYPTALKPAIYDWYTGLPAVGQVAKPTSGVWNYNVFASASGSSVPRIIIRLKNVEVNSNPIAGTRFITVKGMKKDDVPLATIEAGKVYSIAAGELLFDEKDISEKPNQNLIDVEVKVTLATWKVVTVKPEI